MPAAVLVRVFLVCAGTTGCIALLAEAFQHLWLLGDDGTYSSSLSLDPSFSLALRPRDAGSLGESLTAFPAFRRTKFFCLGSF